MSHTWLEVLQYIDSNACTTSVKLANDFGVDTNRVTGDLLKLYKWGYVTRMNTKPYSYNLSNSGVRRLERAEEEGELQT